MKMSRIKFNKIKVFFSKLPRILGEKAFLFFLALLFLALIFSGIVFYRYSFLIQNKKPEISQSEKPIQFKEKIYQDILQIWQEREERFNEAETKQYPDPFKESATTTEESAATEESATTTID